VSSSAAFAIPCIVESPTALLPPRCTPQGCGAPANQSWDSDHDGIGDSMCVYDFDGDTALEIDDIQDAVASLTAAPRKFVTVLAGNYLASANPSARSGRAYGLLELPSDTVLTCRTGAALRGPQSVAATSNYAVVSNADHTAGNRNITISGCEIDGGALDAFTESPGGYMIRMGVYLRRTTDSLIENNFVHHTYHTGLYTSNSTRDVFRNNRIEDAGGYGNQSSGVRPRYPCIYAYSFGGSAVVDFVAEDNDMHRCAADGLNTRAETADAPGDVIRNLRWTGNRIEDTGNSTDVGGSYRAVGSVCMGIRGVDGAVIADNTCVSSGPVYLYPASAYRSQGNEDANNDVSIQRQVIEDADSIAGVWIGPYVDGLTMTDVTVSGTRDDEGRAMDLSCFVINPPFRGATFTGLDLSDCGRIGFEEGNQAGTGAAPDEVITISDVQIDGAGLFSPSSTVQRPGMWFRGPHNDLVIDRASVLGTTGPGIQFDGRLQHVALRDLSIDGVEHGWLGSFAESGAPDCDDSNRNHWISTTNASASTDCNFSGGTGAASARCFCSTAGWTPLPPRQHAGIEIAAAYPPSLDVQIERTTVANERDDTGVRIRGSFTGFAVTSLIGEDTGAATDLEQNSAIKVPNPSSDIALSDVSCQGTDPRATCVEYEPEPGEAPALLLGSAVLLGLRRRRAGS
jgi:parallel beta-helix repeat protein